MSTTGSARFDVAKVGPLLEAAHERLSSVVIERLPWSDFLTRYDRPGTLFYLDPPYYGCENDYGRDLFDRAQFAQMADHLRTLKGRFLSSTITPTCGGSSRASRSTRCPCATQSGAWTTARSWAR
jgi:DNA adenine methylase